jgi:hypothetical protein
MSSCAGEVIGRRPDGDDTTTTSTHTHGTTVAGAHVVCRRRPCMRRRGKPITHGRARSVLEIGRAGSDLVVSPLGKGSTSTGRGRQRASGWPPESETGHTYMTAPAGYPAPGQRHVCTACTMYDAELINGTLSTGSGYSLRLMIGSTVLDQCLVLEEPIPQPLKWEKH